MSKRRPDETFENYKTRRSSENFLSKYRPVNKVNTGKYVFWLSFAETQPPLGRGHLGVVILRADTNEDALIIATAQSLNPGGEMKAVALHPEYYKRVKKHMNKLLTENELENLGLVRV